jgi:hypothetical protein
VTLPAALMPFYSYNQFITYTVKPKSDGKLDKIPTNWQTGMACDAHDPTNWTTYEVAQACGNGYVGFVFTDNDPFWFLDIDSCLQPDNTWSPQALEVCTALQGCAVEVSISGRGLHLFGTGHVPRHKATGGDERTGKLEFYHTKRFVALGSGAVGDAARDCSAGIALVVSKYFARADDPKPTEWSIVPVPEWRGSADDEELIRRMLNSKSAGSAFGVKASARDLWDANGAVLAAVWPDPAHLYDSSAADAALAQHLAFWTGKDCARIVRLMRRSQLLRPKWDREDYLPRTVLNAISMQRDVCIDKPPPSQPAPSPVAAPVSTSTFLTPDAQLNFFQGCIYIADINRILVPGGTLYNKERFDVMYGGMSFVMDLENAKVNSSAWDCFTNSKAVKFPKAHTTAFRPDRLPGDVWQDGETVIANTYWPINVPSKKGNPRPFLEHLEKLLPDAGDRAILLAYMAAVVQHKGVKFQWAPLIQGTRGNGKTLLSRCLVRAIGRAHCHTPKADQISEKYNDWLEDKIFIAVEDIYVPHEKQEVLELLKPMITSDWQEIRGMQQDKVARDICANFMLNSNHRDAIRMTEDNRGIAVFYTAQQHVRDLKPWGMDGDYFPRLYDWLNREGYAIVTDYLQSYTIPIALNPARECHRAPRTTSTAAAIRESLGSVEQEILAAIAEERPGFKGGWVSMHFVDRLLIELNLARSITRARRRQIVEELGYFRHPGVPNGQPFNSVSPDGTKPCLYLKQGHPHEALQAGDVGRQYSADQNTPAAIFPQLTLVAQSLV